MFEGLVVSLEQIMALYGAWGILIGSILEEIVAPIPSTLVVMGSSFLIMKGSAISLGAFGTLFLNVVIPAAVGVTLGSLFLYSITYYAGKPVIERWGKYFGVSWSNVEGLEKRFEESRSDELILFLLRALPVVPSVIINAFCGVIRYEIKRYLSITFFGTIVRTLILGFIGWQFGNLYQDAAQQISYLEEGVLVVIVIGFILFILYKLRNKN